MKQRIYLTACLALLLLNTFAQPNVAVVRIGSGSGTLTTAGTAVFVDVFSSTGTLNQTIALPTVASGNNNPFTLSGTSTSEGALTLSADGRYLVLAGYSAVTGTANVSSAAGIDRVIAMIDGSGNVNTATGIAAGGAYSANSFRGAATVDGTGFWGAGAGTGGTYYVPFGAVTNTPVQVSAAPTNTRTVNIFDGQLYISAASSSYLGVSSVGSGLPANTGNTTTLLAGTGVSSSPYAFYFFDLNPNVAGVDVLYVTDDRTSTGGGLYKFSLVGGTWTANGSIANFDRMHGVTGYKACGSGDVNLFLTTESDLYSFTDTAGYNQTMAGNAPVVIASASTNTKFMGVAVAPGSANAGTIQINESVINVRCNGESNGAITLTPTGGNGTYTYNWGSGITTSSRTNLAAGDYVVTITDTTGCSTIDTITVTQPDVLVADVTADSSTCFGEELAQLSLTISGGTPSYTFQWSDPNVTLQSQFVVGGVTYTATVTDASGCTAIDFAFAYQPDSIVISLSGSHISCYGDSTSLQIQSITGGIAPYNLLWANNIDTAHVAAGTYTLTVTDAGNCTATATTVITQSAELVLSAQPTDAPCYGDTGSIAITSTGGSTPYSYFITPNINALKAPAGTYMIVALDQAQCSDTVYATVNQPDSMQITVQAAPVLCVNDTVTTSVVVNGGTLPYAITWNGNPDVGSITAGTYTIVVTDAAQCSATTTYTVEPADTLLANPTVTNISCFGAADGSATLNITGGVLPYNTLWSPSAPAQVGPGTYSATVTDANNCSVSVTVNITQPADLFLSYSLVSTTCPGGSDGKFDLTVAGGTTPYSYVWSPANINPLQLPAGDYEVTITDANGCSAEASGTVESPFAFVLTPGSVPATCSGISNGVVTLQTIGGTPPYTNMWSNNIDTANVSAGTYTVTVTDANNCTATASVTVGQGDSITVTPTITNVACNGAGNGNITVSASGGSAPYTYTWSPAFTPNQVAAGSYTVTVTDAGNCSTVKTVAVTEPDSLTATFVVTNVTSFGGNDGRISVVATGGTTPYGSYVWNNSLNAPNISALTVGTYCVTITDANNCTFSDCAVVSQPTSIGETSFAVSKVYPFNGGLMLEIQPKAGASISIDITDVMGRSIYAEVINAQSDVIKRQVNGANLHAGYYILRLSNGIEISTRKFVFSR